MLSISVKAICFHSLSLDLWIPFYRFYHNNCLGLGDWTRRLNFLLVARCSFLFALCSSFFGRCSLLFSRCSLLFGRCSLLFVRCSLLFARCSLLFARYFQAFMSNCPTISHKCYYYLPSRWVLYIFVLGVTQGSRKRGRGVSPKFHLVAFVFRVNQENKEVEEGPRFPCVTPVVESSWDLSSSYNKLLDRVAFKILSNIYDGALLRKWPTILTTIISTKKLYRGCSTGLWMWSFQIKFYKIISFRNCKKNGLTIAKPHRKYFPCKFLRLIFLGFDKFFWMVVFKAFSPCKTSFKVDIKSLVIPQLISFWCCLYCNILTRFYLLYVLEELEVVARKCSLKKVFLKISQDSQENICTGVSFAIKLSTGGLQLH